MASTATKHMVLPNHLWVWSRKIPHNCFWLGILHVGAEKVFFRKFVFKFSMIVLLKILWSVWLWQRT